jgi:hypothetical protein
MKYSLILPSESISNSSSSISIGSGLAGLFSGFGSISPGRNVRGSSVVSSRPSRRRCAWSLNKENQ